MRASVSMDSAAFWSKSRSLRRRRRGASSLKGQLFTNNMAGFVCSSALMPLLMAARGTGVLWLNRKGRNRAPSRCNSRQNTTLSCQWCSGSDTSFLNELRGYHLCLFPPLRVVIWLGVMRSLSRNRSRLPIWGRTIYTTARAWALKPRNYYLLITVPFNVSVTASVCGERLESQLL